MQLGHIIGSLSDEATARDALLGCGDLTMLMRVDIAAQGYDETPGEYAASALRRFANLAGDEDWLGLMNVIERADDPAARCLIFMIDWSLNQDERLAAAPQRAACSCGGGCGS